MNEKLDDISPTRKEEARIPVIPQQGRDLSLPHNDSFHLNSRCIVQILVRSHFNPVSLPLTQLTTNEGPRISWILAPKSYREMRG